MYESLFVFLGHFLYPKDFQNTENLCTSMSGHMQALMEQFNTFSMRKIFQIASELPLLYNLFMLFKKQFIDADSYKEDLASFSKEDVDNGLVMIEEILSCK